VESLEDGVSSEGIPTNPRPTHKKKRKPKNHPTNRATRKNSFIVTLAISKGAGQGQNIRTFVVGGVVFLLTPDVHSLKGQGSSSTGLVGVAREGEDAF